MRQSRILHATSRLTLATFILGLVLAGPLYSAEKAKVCARYQTNSGWSKGYSVQANVMKGIELIQKTHNYNYMSHATYVVIFWDRGEASLIELDFPALSAVPMKGTDQDGRKWEVAKTNICYM